MSARAAPLLALLLAAAPSRAAFVSSLMEAADTEPLFDAEYFSDLRSFAAPREWDAAWEAAPGGYRVNGASLDCCDLYLDQGLLLARKLTPGLEFRFRFTELSDKDRREAHHWLELEQEFGAGFSAELFGEPTFRKEDADIGAGLRWRRNGWQARARRNAVDFNFNSRGSTTQRYSLKPYTDELTISAPLPGGRAWAGGELDEPTRREIPSENRSFGYRRARLFLGAQGAGPAAPRLEYSYEEQLRSSRYATATAGLSEESRRRAHSLAASARLGLDERGELEPGLAWLSRSAVVSYLDRRPVFHRRWELQPWLRWRRPLSKLVTGELAGFFSFGEKRPETIVEAKLGTGADFVFSPQSRVGLYGTWDLDSPGHVWDGGNIRAMFLF